jgi:hypothetical protein
LHPVLASSTFGILRRWKGCLLSHSCVLIQSWDYGDMHVARPLFEPWARRVAPSVVANYCLHCTVVTALPAAVQDQFPASPSQLIQLPDTQQCCYCFCSSEKEVGAWREQFVTFLDLLQHLVRVDAWLARTGRSLQVCAAGRAPHADSAVADTCSTCSGMLLAGWYGGWVPCDMPRMHPAVPCRDVLRQGMRARSLIG